MSFFDWVDSILPANPFANGGTPDTSGGPIDTGGGGDFGPPLANGPQAGNAIVFAGNPQPVKATPVAPNSSFKTGLNLLLDDPGSFFQTLFSSDASSVSNAAVKSAAETPTLDRLPSLPPASAWITIGVITLAIGATAFLIHEIRKA